MNEGAKLKETCITLHKWSEQDIRNVIQCWGYNDIKYMKIIRKTIEIY